MWPFRRKQKQDAQDHQEAPQEPVVPPDRWVVPAPIAQPVSQDPVTFAENGDIEISVHSSADAKLALKQLRLRKRELALLKRSYTAEQRELRAGYTDQVRRRSPVMRGGGGVGQFVRAVQGGSRASARKNLAKDLAPVEEKRHTIDQMIGMVDEAILKIESYLLKSQDG
jgi:hypothetical protein